jgi:pimeloyl-ACP methyl ester carboxylesterase
MLYVPSSEKPKTEILFIYGQHSSLERWWGLLTYLSHYGNVTAPDLPGLGGMTSFYTVKQKPTIDSFADYLAAFVKLRYKRKKVVIVAVSFGFVIVTRMLQRYPELTKKVTVLVSLVGFTHSNEFTFKKTRRVYYHGLTFLLSHRLPASVIRHTTLSTPVLRALYSRSRYAKAKFKQTKPGDKLAQMNAEIWLWHNNDIRTQAVTTGEFLKLDNCRVKINLPIWHVVTDEDQYFDHNRIEQHLRVIFPLVQIAHAKLESHTPSVVANESEAMSLIPPEVRHALRHL